MQRARVDELPRVSGAPAARCRLRAAPEDFRVIEQSQVQPSGTGEHEWLRVRKRNANTADVARVLAKHAGVPLRDVGYAGLKDRNAVTEQWFSIRMAGRPSPDWGGLATLDLIVLEQQRHTRKLQRGALAGNRFAIVLRALDGDRDRLAALLEGIAIRGVPNYFTEQRFGRDDGNLRRAEALFGGRSQRLSRHQRGLALSAARSLLFNQVLAARVGSGCWDRGMPGDAMQLDGSRSRFVADVIDADIDRRLTAFDIHPTGPLCGRGESPAVGECRDFEAALLADYAEYTDGLSAAGLRQERRALRVMPAGLDWQWQAEDALELSFGLPPGSYATAVLRELVAYDL